MYDESVLLPWLNALRCVKAAISSDFGLVHSSRLSRIVLRLSRLSCSSVFKYVLASFPAHRVTNFILVSAFLMCDSTVSMRSSTSSLQSLNLWCKPASSVQSIWGPCMYCIFWCAIFSVCDSLIWFTLLLTPCELSYLCVLFVYVCMCKNQCIRLTLSILFASTFSHNIDTCYLNGAQVATESSRLKHWPRKTIMVIYNTTITTIV